MLVYIHWQFAAHPLNCLDHVKDSWPRDGVLRVEIIPNAPPDYNLEMSYEKERRLQLRAQNPQDELSLLFQALTQQS